MVNLTMLKKLTLSLALLLFLPQVAVAARPTPPPPAPNSVCIDAGHGGSDPGTSNQGLKESDVNLQVANLLKTRLEAANYTVYMTRTTDVALSNADRYNYCNAQNTSILLSIHHNGSTDTTVDYSQGLYMKKTDVALAQAVVNSVSSSLGTPNKGLYRFASGVLLKANMPAAISEGFFLTNNNEYTLITAANRLDQEADALFSAIQGYFGN